MSNTSIPFKLPVRKKANFLSSLRDRILFAMVMVGFFAALISGSFFQYQAKQNLERNIDSVRDQYVSRVEQSALPERVKEQVVDLLELRLPQVRGRNIVDFSFTQAIIVVVLTAILAAVIAFGIGWWLTGKIVYPLERLKFASQLVAQGDFSQRVKVEGDDEINQVAYSFNFMAEELQNTETKRRQLLSDVAHELKTPLASIQGHVEALRDNLPRAKANPDAIYDIVLEDVSALDRMIGSLRTWLNAQSLIDHLEIKTMSLKEEIPSIIARFQPAATTKKVLVDWAVADNAALVAADRNALRHVISNLVDNALRYTPEGGRVRVMTWQGEYEQPSNRPSGKLTIAVADTGVGIAREHWAHLFERFYRVDKSRSRDTGGTGLGLALVKDLVEAQGGRVWLNSEIGKGTIFFVALPIPKM
jgi:two-component system, OmpR family, sensor histidine kinase BaeS